MFANDAQARLQLAHEYAEALARDYRRAQREAPRRRRRLVRLLALLPRLRNRRLHRAPAYRA
jgi:hypothetical protein